MHRVQEHEFVDLAIPVSGGCSGRQGFSRRTFIAAAVTTAAATAMAPDAFARNFGPDADPVRYPEPDVVVMDKRFKYKLGNAPLQRLYKGTMWAEGPGVERCRPLPHLERYPDQ